MENEKTIYVMFDAKKDGDEFIHIYESYEEAKDSAISEWMHTTPSERKIYTIYIESYQIPADAEDLNEAFEDAREKQDPRPEYLFSIEINEYGEEEIWEKGAFAKEFKALRAKIGLSQAKLSKAIGIPRRTIENWESVLFEPDDFKKKAVLKEMRKLAGEELPDEDDDDEDIKPEYMKLDDFIEKFYGVNWMKIYSLNELQRKAIKIDYEERYHKSFDAEISRLEAEMDGEED